MVNNYYIYLLKLTIIPHKLFWPNGGVFFNLNPPPPTHTHTNCGQLFWRKSWECKKVYRWTYRRTDRERFMDRQSNVCTDRQTDKTYQKNLSWTISSVELKKNCVYVYQCALRHPFCMLNLFRLCNIHVTITL